MNVDDPSRDDVIYSDNAFEAILDHPLCVEIIKCLPKASEQVHLFLSVARALYSRWEYQHLQNDLDRSIQLFEEAEPLISPNSQHQVLWFNELGQALMSRFEQNGLEDDLSRVIELGERAIVACPAHRLACLSNLAYALQNRFEIKGWLPDLDKAITLLEEAVETAAIDDPNRASLLTNLGSALELRFENTGTGSVDDLNRAIEVQEEAVASAPNDPNLAAFLNNLGNVLQSRYEQLGDLEDLNLAIENKQKAVEFTSEEDLKLADWLNNLGIALQSRFERTGSLQDLVQAIEAMDKSVKLTAPHHIDRPDSLHNLGMALLKRFEQTGSLDDLDRAIKIHAEADVLTPSNHISKAIYLSNLGNVLSARFERIGAIDDLNRAIEVKTEALRLTPAPHPDRASWLIDLGIVLHSRFERTRSMDHLKHAIEIKEQARDATPEYSPNRAVCLDNLGISLQSLFEETGSLADLNYAITTKDEALMLTPDDHADRAQSLNNLANSLQSRFEVGGSKNDLDTAIKLKEEAVARTPAEHTHRAARLHNLAISLQRRFEATGSASDVEEAIRRNEEAANCVTAPPTIRIKAARMAADSLINHDLSRANRILLSAVQLLPFVSPRTLEQSDRQYIVSQFAGLTAEAVSASLASGDPLYHAVELLELGRGVLANLQIEIRSDISSLSNEHPEVARRFEYLRNVLDRPQTEMVRKSFHQLSQEEERNLRKEMDNLVTRIRQLNKQFLCVTSELEIRNIAKDGTVILFNISKLRSDAIIIEETGIRTLNLPHLTQSDLVEWTQTFLRAIQDAQRDPVKSRRDLKRVLEWLWDIAMSPIFELVGFKSSPPDGETWPRVWWVASGLLNMLPLHAAGYHDDGSGRTVIDRVVSSYTPTIKSLMYARDRTKNQANVGEVKALAVVMPETPDQVELENVKTELQMLQTQFRNRFLTVKSCPTRTEVLDELLKHQLVHFSCHGISDIDPSKSMLLLMDWKTQPLTLPYIASLNIDCGQFAYLSACHSARGLDVQLLDESINLSAAMQLAGYPSVVGTLWQVMDKTAAEVAEHVYSWLLRDGDYLQIQKSAEGLHHAIRAAREQSRIWEGHERKVPSNPFVWASYIHVGV